MRRKSGWLKKMSRASWLALTVLMGALFLYQLAYAVDPTGTPIDTFDSDQDVTINVAAPATADDATVFAGAMGGERDIFVNKTVGAVNERVRVASTSASGELVVSVDSNVQATAEIVWDGTDGDATSLDHTGLSAIDLATNPIYPFDGFNILFTESDLAVGMTLEVYSDASNWSSAVITTPAGLVGGVAPQSVFVPFSSFTTQAGTGANFSSVGAIRIVYNANVAYDGVIDFIEVQSRDYGDLPSVYSNTLAADDGARHVIGDLYLGGSIDGESDGQEDPDAGRGGLGDDNPGVSDDENGVVRVGSTWSTGLVLFGNGSSVDVTVTGGQGCLSGWIDWTGDNDFNDTGLLADAVPLASENVIAMVPVSTASNPNTIGIDVPDSAISNSTHYARFRLVPDSDNDGDCSDEPTVGVTGQAFNGEVEDYEWEFGPTAINLQSVDASGGSIAPFIILSVTGLTFVSVGLFIYMRRRKVAESIQ